MGFWGAIEETVVDGAAGAVGMVPMGIGEVGGAAIHGADALIHGAIGGIEALVPGGSDGGAHALNATRELGSAAIAAIPGAGHVAAGLDLGQAVANTVIAGSNAISWGMSGFEHDGHNRTTGERINEMGREGSLANRWSGHSSSDTNPIWEGWGGW